MFCSIVNDFEIDKRFVANFLYNEIDNDQIDRFVKIFEFQKNFRVVFHVFDV